MSALNGNAAQVAMALEEYAGGSHTVDDIETALEAGTMQLWEAPNSVVLTQVVMLPQYNELVFFLAVGNMEEIRTLYPIILEWGKEKGCTRAAFIGRPGWARSFVTKEEGWEATHTLYTKDLTDG